ncbi:malate:quinone oxidoreductase [Arcticibacter sp. MXS-1]|uniref:malate:quinone oxidoreductase n=1 Tax=Arcticibacter sp. MXS-1 TaxID=3341726 RepID=UPI0035A97BED
MYNMNQQESYGKSETDVVLIGAGIMSATLGILLKQLEPNIRINIYERQNAAATESSDAWNNAGTGHSAFCELNYTPQLPDGSIDTTKAVKIAESFEISRQFWASVVESGYICPPKNFIRSIPHISFVWGDQNVEYLRKRYEAMVRQPIFKGMEYSDDPEVLKQWIPLVMQGRDRSQKVAATRMVVGTDVNFGALTRCMFTKLQSLPDTMLEFQHDVRDLRQDKNGRWHIRLKDLVTRKEKEISARFVFIGAGGGSLPLLLKSGIKEGKGFGGFPVSGQWLVCTNPAVIEKHEAKVYGKAEVGSPPMSVPHLDTRVINGKKALLFGPYAGFSTKFLKKGSFFDLLLSLRPNNIIPMISAGLANLPLTRYLVGQVVQSPEDRLQTLRDYFPNARMEDWELEVAGQRVQVIKKDPKKGGILEFGTEVVSESDGTLAALLGASPGASTAVAIMLNLLERCFKEEFKSERWQAKLRELIPSFGTSLNEQPELCAQLREHTSRVLNLKMAPVAEAALEV